MSSRASRTLRGLAIAAVSTAVAAVSHTLAGGYRPNLPSLALALVFASLTSVALAGRRGSAWRTTASVGVSQLAFHAIFSAIGTGATVEHLGHHLDRVVAGADHAHSTDPRMWLAHAVAGAITAMLLRYGETALAAVRRRLEPALPRVAVIAVAAPVPALEPIALPRLLDRVLASLSFRGPPVVLAAL